MIDNKMTNEDFRKILIATMCYANQLKDSELGSGYTDWHDENGKCGITFTLNSEEKFSMIITKD